MAEQNVTAARAAFTNTAISEALRVAHDVYPVQLWCAFSASGEFVMQAPSNPAQLSLMIHLLQDALILGLKKPQESLITGAPAELAARFRA